MKAKVLRLGAWIMSYIPCQLPQSEEAMRLWVSKTLDMANLPQNESFGVALASMVLHLDSGSNRASQRGFIRQLKRRIANQCAFNVMTDLKEAEKKRLEQEKIGQQGIQEASKTVVQEIKG